MFASLSGVALWGSGLQVLPRVQNNYISLKALLSLLPRQDQGVGLKRSTSLATAGWLGTQPRCSLRANYLQYERAERPWCDDWWTVVQLGGDLQQTPLSGSSSSPMLWLRAVTGLTKRPEESKEEKVLMTRMTQLPLRAVRLWRTCSPSTVAGQWRCLGRTTANCMTWRCALLPGQTADIHAWRSLMRSFQALHP